MIKTCLIYGQNGLDLDVVYNLLSFYKSLNYWVAFSDKLYDSNLLVILRAVNKPIDCSMFNFEQIHVYDYGGWSYDGCIKSLVYEKTYVFTTSLNHKEHIVNKLGFPSNHVYLSFPPVETSLWVENSKERKYKFVHIGNFKKIDESDDVREKFNTAIKDLKVDIWGLNWELEDNSLYHGKTGVFNVSKIYSQSQFALGLMYPFQRDITFSGRFWHAPLNGCYLFSEKSLYSNVIPGVIETNYSSVDIETKIKLFDSPEILQQEAVKYWKTQSENLKKQISSFQILYKNKPFLVIFFILSLQNRLRMYYQKYELFKIFRCAR